MFVKKPVFVPGKHFQSDLLFVSKTKAYPRVKHLNDVSLG